MTMRVAIVNPVWDASLKGPDETLRRFRSLTGWASAVADAGASVTVHQRFPFQDTRVHAGVPYAFVRDRGGPVPDGVWTDMRNIAASVLAAGPNLVHVNGVVFPRWLRALRRRLPASMRLVAQDHGGWHPADVSRLSRMWVRHGLAVVDAVLVSSPGHIELWRRAHALPPRVQLADVMESSVDVVPVERDQARELSGVDGDPAVLWVGRLTPNKDPLPVLHGFTRFLAAAPQATMTWVFAGGAMENALRRVIQGDPRLAARVRIVGAVPHAELGAFYSAADIYVSGSRVEGSGYAAIEAMACGAAPVLSDIPSFHAMTDGGRVGALWAPGDAQSLAHALTRVSALPREPLRTCVRARFDEALSWEVIGRRALAIYDGVCAR